MALNAYLKIDGITTNSDGVTAPATIEVMSFSWGVENSSVRSTGGGGGAGKVNFNPIKVHKTLDAASPQLFAACANGKHLGNAVIGVLLPAVQDSGAPSYMKYAFSDVIISQVEAGGNAGGSPLPVEIITIEFREAAILLPAVQ